MTLEQFGVVARALLIMIYQNAYPDVVSQINDPASSYNFSMKIYAVMLRKAFVHTLYIIW